MTVAIRSSFLQFQFVFYICSSSNSRVKCESYLYTNLNYKFVKIKFYFSLSNKNTHYFLISRLYSFAYFIHYLTRMLPFQKIITLIIRTMAKPMLTLAKKKHQEKKFEFLNGFFIAFGRKYSRTQHWINWKIVKSTKQQKMKELKQEVALEKGIEGLYEIFFYSIIIGLPLYEMHRGSVATEVKEEKLSKQIEGLEKNLDDIVSKLQQLFPKSIHLDLQPFILKQKVQTSSQAEPHVGSQIKPDQ